MAWLSANGRGDVGSALICTHMKCGEYTLPGRVRSDTADLVAGNSMDLSIEARPMRPTAPIDVVSKNGDASK